MYYTNNSIFICTILIIVYVIQGRMYSYVMGACTARHASRNLFMVIDTLPYVTLPYFTWYSTENKLGFAASLFYM